MTTRLTVCGGGAMGSQIAMVGALAGCRVTLYDLDDATLDRSVGQLRGHLDRKVAKGKLSESDRDAAFDRLVTTTSLTEAATDCEFMIEAIIEDLEAKRALFAEFAAAAPPAAVLATNSSSIVSSKLADGLPGPDRVCNMHFFNPALVMELVEVVEGPHTSEATVEAAMDLARRMGKHPVHLKKEIFGFVVNRILGAIFDEAIALREAGIAGIEDIDVACRKGLGHPTGPFELLDMTGIDVNYHIKLLRAQDSGDPADGPSRSLEELYEAGRMGRKTGAGFYEYPEQAR